MSFCFCLLLRFARRIIFVGDCYCDNKTWFWKRCRRSQKCVLFLVVSRIFLALKSKEWVWVILFGYRITSNEWGASVRKQQNPLIFAYIYQWHEVTQSFFLVTNVNIQINEARNIYENYPCRCFYLPIPLKFSSSIDCVGIHVLWLLLCSCVLLSFTFTVSSHSMKGIFLLVIHSILEKKAKKPNLLGVPHHFHKHCK